MKLENYELDKFLGSGAFGEVYLTSKKGDSRKFATKKLDREQMEKEEGAMKYLRNEIVILQFLNHPNIVKFEEVKKTKKHFYIIMEYCNGGDLTGALEKYREKYGKPFPEEIVQHFMKQIISAFKYLHSLKVIHRDVKTDNILLNYDNEEDKNNFNLMKAQVKIIDFGFSCKVSPKGLQYSVLGSPINMDPLILKKLNSSTNKTRQLGYNESADIWSIGTVCYEMLIGKSVFDAEEMEELVKKVEDGGYEVPTNLSHEVVSFMNGMLQYEGKRRLTAAQLSRHEFLTKNVKDFHAIDLKKVSKKTEDGKVKINVKSNTTIWSIFNADSQSLLSSIVGNQFIKPIDEKEELAFEEMKKAGPNSTTASFVQLPSKGIPDNPTDTSVKGMTKEELDSMKNKETNYTFSGSIFDDK
jgi:serine/threonine protein kinase